MGSRTSPDRIEQGRRAVLFTVSVLCIVSVILTASAAPTRRQTAGDAPGPLHADAAAVESQTVTVGAVSGPAGAMLTVPLTLSASVKSTALLLRLQYDPFLLSRPQVAPGNLLGPEHTLLSRSPEAGRLNILVADLARLTPFEAHSGVVARVTFDTNSNAPVDSSDITLTTVALPDIPASGLLDAEGANLSHTVLPGEVSVDRRADSRYWMLY